MPRRANSIPLDRTTVVRAAVALADARGLEQVTMADLAEHLKIRPPSLYNHITGITGLRRELALLGQRELMERMGKAVMGKSGDNAIVALADAYRIFVKEHPGLYSATISAPPIDDTELQAVSQELIAIILKVLAAYNLHRDDAIHAVRMLRSIVHGFATLENARGFEMPLDRDETFRRLVNMFIMSIKQ
jgi:AcrR family transcriptional regulator